MNQNEETMFLRDAEFVWDNEKLRLNCEKHKISFESIRSLLIESYDSTVQFDSDKKEEKRISLMLLDKNRKSWQLIFKIVENDSFKPIVFRIISLHRKNSGTRHSISKEIWKKRIIAQNEVVNANRL
jgi:uncharacterized DUF497 family protein